MSVKNDYKHTILASYGGYITQAVVNNFAPLLFLIFRAGFGIPLEQITLLVTVNFLIQLGVDFISAWFVDKLGYRACIIAAHIAAAAGLAGMGALPFIMPPFAGLMLSVVLYAIGGGLIEVLISPIVEACPTDNKASAMGLLHSFYCWGTVFVILVSTGFLAVFGRESWRIMAFIWAALPLANAVYFTRVPIAELTEKGEGMSVRALCREKLFWVLAVLMIAAGACEQGMSQWASAFAESGLGISKTAGDLLGPCLFSVFMGTARVLYSKMSSMENLLRFVIGSGVLCIFSYLLAALSPLPALSLVGCTLCGFSVGVLWPGVFSLAAAECPKGGTAMFALLALAGDLGCSGGPTAVGFAAGAFGGELKIGLIFAVVFPVMLIAAAIVFLRITRKKTEE